MRCEKAQEIFSDYLEGTLERPMAFTLEHHLGECPACGREYESFRETWQILDTLPAVEVPLGLRESVIDKLREQQAVRRKPVWSFDFSNLFQTRVMVRAAAACAAVTLFGVMLFQAVTPDQDQVPDLTQGGIPGMTLPETTTIPDNDYNIYPGEPTSPITDPGMQITVTGSPISGERILYKIHLKHSDGSKVTAKAYLMDQGSARLTRGALDSANLLMDQTLKEDQQSTLSVVTDRNSNGDVVYIKWDHDSMSASEVVFLPGNLNTTGVADMPFAVSDVTIHEALQKLSSTYGVVVMADAGISGKVGQMSVDYGSVDKAAYWMLKSYSGDKALNWKPVKYPNVFKVEQQ